MGYVQGASTLMGPFLVIFFGMGLVTLPEAARILRRSPRHLPLFCALVSAGLSVLAIAWGTALLVALPLGLGQFMLGSIWRPTYPLVLPLLISIIGGCAQRGRRRRPARPRRRQTQPARDGADARRCTSSAGSSAPTSAAPPGPWTARRSRACSARVMFWWQLRVALRDRAEVAAAAGPGTAAAEG